MKHISILLLLLSVCGPAFAGDIDVWYKGDSNFGTAYITNSSTGNARLVVDEVAAELSGSVSISGEFELASTSLSVTNGQIISLSTVPVIRVSAAGQGGATTTNTLAAVSSAYVGNTYYLVNVGASNGVLVADSAPAYNSGVTLGQYDVSAYYVVATNVIVQTSTINN